jgi:tetratricopeptide (TPR) repeat protein
MRDDVDAAERFAREAVAVASSLGDDRASSGALMALGDVHTVQGEHELALGRYEEAVALRRQLGDPLLVSDAVYNLGLAAFHAGDQPRARRAFEDALSGVRDLGEVPHMAAAQFMLAELDILEGDSASARDRARESLALYTDLGDARSRARCHVVLACAAATDGSPEEAARSLGAANALRGDDPPDDFERPLLDRWVPELVAALGEQRVVELGLEGGRVGTGAAPLDIVTTSAIE